MDFQVPDGFGRFLSLKPATFRFLKVSVTFCRCSEELSDGCSLPVVFSHPTSLTG
ncbi:hypothetical protein A2U01_0098572 [Trifolium medium]|nr:hypothetical protein [Trifolium medium]